MTTAGVALDALGLDVFGLDPTVIHLNHGAYGVAPVSVRAAVTAWQHRAERNPHRFNRIELPELIAGARADAAAYLGIRADACALVRNASEGFSAVLQSLDLRAGDEIVLATHGYGAMRIASNHWATRRGIAVVDATFPVGASDDEIIAAYLGAVGERTRLVVLDAITSPTATVLPVAATAAAVADRAPWARVFVDAAHVPGSMPADIEQLGVAYWIGNLHKWAYTPRGSALMWVAEPLRDTTFPSLLSWQLPDGFPRSFDYPATWDYSGWLAIGDGVNFWTAIGGWDRVEQLSALADAGQRIVADALGTGLDRLPVHPAPTMRMVRLPSSVTLRTRDDVDALYERLSGEYRIEAIPTAQDGIGYLRLAAAPYNTEDDYRALADAVASLFG